MGSDVDQPSDRAGYDCHDPESDLRKTATGLEAPVVGMLSAAPVARFTTGAQGRAKAVAIVGLSPSPLREPCPAPYLPWAPSTSS